MTRFNGSSVVKPPTPWNAPAQKADWPVLTFDQQDCMDIAHIVYTFDAVGGMHAGSAAFPASAKPSTAALSAGLGSATSPCALPSRWPRPPSRQRHHERLRYTTSRPEVLRRVLPRQQAP